LEKKFELDEVLEPVRKKMMKKKAKGKLNSDEEEWTIDSVLADQYGYTRPTMWDLLPLVIYRGTVSFVTSIPQRMRDWKERSQLEKERKREEEERVRREEEELREAMEEKASRKEERRERKPQSKFRDISEMDEIEQEYKPGASMDFDSDDDDCQMGNRKGEDWTDEDIAALAKAMAKFPGGTPGRWDRIAHDLGRSNNEILAKVKEMKVSLAKNIPVAATQDPTLVKKNSAANISDAVITRAIDMELEKTSIITDSMLYQSQDDIPDDYDEVGGQEGESAESYIEPVRKRKVKTRPVDEAKEADEAKQEANGEASVENGEASHANGGEVKENGEKEEDKAQSWSQVQQKCLETAIAQFPKSTTDRWTCIARMVPGKNKEECITRYKLLVEHIKQKKSNKKES